MTAYFYRNELRARGALLTLFVLASLSGCGGGSGGGGDATGAVLLSSTPADGETRVSTLANV